MKYRNTDFISIGRFAELVGTTRSRLLFYDNKGIFSPMSVVKKNHQAPNRQYSPHQVFDYNLLQLLQNTGITLEEGNALRHAPINEQLERLQAHTEELERNIKQLRRMQDSLRVLQRFNEFITNTPREKICRNETKTDLRFRFFPFSREVTRDTNLYLEALAKMNRVVAESDDLLSGPFGTVYSAHRTDDFYPVKGILVPYVSNSTQTHPDDCILPAGEYLTVWAHREVGTWVTLAEHARRHMIENDLRRASVIVGWALASDCEDGTVRLTELMSARVVHGKTAPGELPIEPGVDDPTED